MQILFKLMDRILKFHHDFTAASDGQSPKKPFFTGDFFKILRNLSAGQPSYSSSPHLVPDHITANYFGMHHLGVTNSWVNSPQSPSYIADPSITLNSGYPIGLPTGIL